MAMASVQPRRWSRQEFDRLAKLGAFREDERVELLDGEICEMTPIGSQHAAAVDLASEALRLAFGAGHVIRVQSPVALDDWSQPQPDVSVVRGSARDFFDRLPDQLLLVVEVALSSVTDDRRKGSLYARAGVPDYWIVNLDDNLLEVFRGPIEDSRAPTGWSYRSVTTYRKGDEITPLAKPEAIIRVADVLR